MISYINTLQSLVTNCLMNSSTTTLSSRCFVCTAEQNKLSTHSLQNTSHSQRLTPQLLLQPNIETLAGSSPTQPAGLRPFPCCRHAVFLSAPPQTRTQRTYTRPSAARSTDCPSGFLHAALIHAPLAVYFPHVQCLLFKIFLMLTDIRERRGEADIGLLSHSGTSSLADSCM